MNLNKKNLWKPMEPNKVKRRYWTAAVIELISTIAILPYPKLGC